MSKQDQQRWDTRYQTPEWGHIPEPSLVVKRYAGSGGRALDVACGRGQNTLWLAEHGYYAAGVDVSRVALRQAAAAARTHGLQHRVSFVQADLDDFRPAPGSLDLVCVLRFLHRPLFPALARALRPGGRLLYATLNWRRLETHPDTDPAYLLSPGELLAAFEGMRVLVYDETEDMTTFVAETPRQASVSRPSPIC